MKTIFRYLVIAVSLLCCTLAMAQYVPAWDKGNLRKAGNNIAVNEQTLDRAATLALLREVGGENFADDWSAAVSKKGLGIGLTAGGFSVSAVGFALALGTSLTSGLFGGLIGSLFGKPSEGMDAGFKGASTASTICLVAGAAGLATGIVGIVQLSSANKTMNSLVDACNAIGPQKQGAVLTVGATPSGAGIALVF